MFCANGQTDIRYVISYYKEEPNFLRFGSCLCYNAVSGYVKQSWQMLINRMAFPKKISPAENGSVPSSDVLTMAIVARYSTFTRLESDGNIVLDFVAFRI